MKTLFICLSLYLLANLAYSFNNPVIPNENNPDPGVIYYDGFYYAVTTSNFVNDTQKFPIHKSKDLQTWQKIGYVFPEANVPQWAGLIADYWAPELHIINGKFRVYFTARDKTGILCIGVGSANNIEGPYTAQQ